MIHVIDDPIDPRVPRTQAEIEATLKWLRETLPERFKVGDDPNYKPILVMARLNREED